MQEELRALLVPLGHPVVWGGLGQGTALPRIALYQVSGTEGATLDGAEGFVKGRVQVDVYGATYASALLVARQVRTTLSGYSGGAIWSVLLDSIRDRPEEDGGEVIQRISLDFAVTYRV